MAGRSGNGYWAGQLVVGGVFAVGGLVGGPVAMTLDREEPGRGLIYLLIGIVFLVFFIVMLRKYLKSNAAQRAAFAWVIGQYSDNDLTATALAEKARTGRLTAKEIAELQAMRPQVPYPGVVPPPDTLRS